MTDPIHPRDPHPLRRLAADHPEWPVMLAAAGAWLYLASRPHAPAAGHHHGPAPVGGIDEAGLAAMVVAMMLPLMLSSVREAAFSGPRPRRAMAAFLAGYLGIWIPVMLLIDIAWKQLFAGGTDAAVGMMVVAALWELTPAKQRQGHGCDTGSRPAGGLVRFGVMAGVRCVASCWALMVLCVAFAHDVRVMAALFGIQLFSRYHRSAAPALAAVGVLVVCLASLALLTAGAHAV